MGTTTNYSWTYPTVNADADAWGTILNNMAIAIDASLKTVDNATAGKAPLASPTFTGTVTLPDSNTVTSTGFSKLGVGMVASNIIDATQTQNAASTISLLNANASTAAVARYLLSNNVGANYDTLLFGGGFTSVGMYRADGVAVRASGAGGLSLLTNAAQPMYFGINAVEKMRLGTDGSLLVGSTTNAGAGCIADAIGNVRNIPTNSVSGGYTLIASDNGKWVESSSGGVTVPNAVFAVGNNLTIFNNTGGNITITQGSGMTMLSSALGTTGNRTLANYGVAVLYFRGSNASVITGTGLT